MRSLFGISDDLHFLQDFLTDTDGDVSDEALEVEIDKWFADLGAERDVKVDNYCALIKEFEAKAFARKVEGERLIGLGQGDSNAAARLKKRLHEFFVEHDIQKIETERFKVARQNNGGSLPVILDPSVAEAPELLPDEYKKVVYLPDNTAIRNALTEDKGLEWARFGPRGEHLRIK